MALLKKKAEVDLSNVRFEVKGEQIDIGGLNRMMRGLMTSVAKKQQKRFGHLQHPETGERPTIVIAIPDPGKPSVQCRLVTDSQPMREWLKQQGIVIDEVVAADAN